MKNIVCILMAAAMMLCLFGCAASTPAETTPSTTAATVATEPTFAYPTEPDGSIKQGRVPNVVGRDAEFAQLDMKAAGFVHVTLEETVSDQPAGTVIAQNIEAYITLPVDTQVVLTVSAGPAA
jgi:hypothetical protein